MEYSISYQIYFRTAVSLMFLYFFFSCLQISRVLKQVRVARTIFHRAKESLGNASEMDVEQLSS